MAGARATPRLGRSTRILAILAAGLGLVIPLVPLFPDPLYRVMPQPGYLAFHNLAELFSVATSFAIFAIAWFSRRQSRDAHALFLGCAFLGVGLVDLAHTLGYAGMPEFFSANSGNKSTQLWVAARLFSAAACLGSAFVDPTSRSRWLAPRLLLAVPLAWAAAVFTVVTFFPDLLPPTYVPGVGLTRVKRWGELAALALFAAGAAAYARRAARSGDPLHALYTAALAICGLSEILFAVYRDVFDTYNVVGHVYKVAAFALFFRGSFIASVQRPREELLAKEEALRREVAEREAAEAARRRTDQKFTAFAEAADQVFWIMGRDPEAIVYVNPAYERVWGRPVAEVTGDPACWRDAIHPADRAAVVEALTRWLQGPADGTYDVSYRIVRPDGATRWIADRGFVLERQDGRVRLLAGIARDVTERMREEEALRDSERRFRQRLDGMMEGCMVIGFDWRYLYVNEAAAQHGHQRRENLVGRTMQEMYPGIEETPLFARYRRCMTDRVPQRFESSFQFPDGTTSWFELSVEPAAEGIFVLSLDVTQRRAAEDQLRQAQKLEAVGRLAGGVAHDFNNLLTVIVGGSSVLKQALPKTGPLRDEVKGIEDAATRAAALTHQLLSFSRRQVVQPSVLDVDEVVAGMDRMLRRLIGEHIELVTVLGAAPGRVRADRGQLEQVIVNLVVNARDAIARQGRIVVETSRRALGVDAAAEAHAGAAVPDRFVSLAVRDDGSGMSAEVQAHLFEPFFTTKELGRGTGLGLSTAYGIVKQAGGAILVRSAPGQGSTFEVLLPQVEGTSPAVAKPERAGIPRGSETILLAEDEPLLRRVVARAFREAGFTVLEAADGEEALRVAETAPFDVLVTDVVMPLLGGVELAERVRRGHPDVRVLFVSGYTDNHLDGAERDGAAALLHKPFTPAVLLRAVRDLLDRRPAAGATAVGPLRLTPAPGNGGPRGGASS